MLEATFPLTSAVCCFGCGSDVVRTWFGRGPNVVQMWFGHAFGSGADNLEEVKRKWFPAGLKYSIGIGFFRSQGPLGLWALSAIPCSPSLTNSCEDLWLSWLVPAIAVFWYVVLSSTVAENVVMLGLSWETDFYTPPVLGGAALFQARKKNPNLNF